MKEGELLHRPSPLWRADAGADLVRRSRVSAWLLLLLTGLVLAAASPGHGQASTILAVTVDGVITPIMADHIRDVLDRAEREGPQALLVQLDTPGGLDTSMRDIIQSFLNAFR